MDQSAEEVVNNLLTEKALEQPSDSVKPDELVLELPKWFDENKFNQGRRFYWDNCFMISSQALIGLILVFAVPSILKVLVGSRRSSSAYTAYKRYLSTNLHHISWYEHELKPGSLSWKSLYAVRSRHVKAGLASKLKGGHYVSQRDVALTQFGFIGIAILSPDKLGVRAYKEGDWEGFCHFWRVIGHMIGLEDRYNICRNTYAETRQVCQLLKERVFRPCLENVPEHFEHMTQVMLDGLWSINPTIEPSAMLYWTKYMMDVPGYIYTEEDRLKLQSQLMEQLKGKPLDSGVDSRTLMSAPKVDGLPDKAPRLLYLRDFETVDNAPEFKKLSSFAKYKLAFVGIAGSLYATWLGRMYFNLNFLFSLLLMKYFPYLAFYRFGIKSSLVDIFVEDPTDDTQPITNEEFYKRKQKKWYQEWLGIFW